MPKTRTSANVSPHFAFDFDKGSDTPAQKRYRQIAGSRGREGSTSGLREDPTLGDHLCVGDVIDPFTCLFCGGGVGHDLDAMDLYQHPCSPNIDPLDPMEVFS